MSSAALLDRQFLEKLERLTIHWEKSFSGLVGGHNSSRFAGGGQEFLDHRHFHHGDDLRAVNWRAYMRLEKLFLKLFHIEPRVPLSAQRCFGGRGGRGRPASRRGRENWSWWTPHQAATSRCRSTSRRGKNTPPPSTNTRRRCKKSP